MHELYALTMLELRAAYGLNRFRYTKDAAAKKRYRMLLFAGIIVVCVVIFYVGGLVWGLCELDLASIVPAYLAAVASVMIFAFGLFKAGASIFSPKGYDILVSMPLRHESLVISRFLALYAENLILTLLVLLPGIAVYGVLEAPAGTFYLMAALGAVFLPGIPLVASSVIGTAVMAASSEMKHKSIVQSLLMVVFVVVILMGSVTLGNASDAMTPELIKNLAMAATDTIGTIYPPALWLEDAMLGSFTGLAALAAASLTAVGMCLWTVSRFFSRIMEKLRTASASHNYVIKDMTDHSLLRALYLRELKRYFSSSIYVTNTIVGPVMAACMSAAICFAGLDSIQAAIPFDITAVVPFALSAVFCMMTTTSTAISMEGKYIWICKSFPVPAKPFLDSKILMNLSIMLPFYLLSQIFLIAGTHPRFPEIIWLLLIPAEIILLSVVLGITANLKLYRFDWEKEEQIVKQSASSAIGGFAGFFLSVILMGIVVITPFPIVNLVRAAICCVLPIITWLFYRQNNKADLTAL